MANLSNINNKFIVEDSGDVGIGVTTATTKLHIGGTAPGDSIIRQDSTVSGTNWEIGERAAGKWQIFEDDGDTIVATFMSTGNVGIGTPSPTYKLDVVGNGRFSGFLEMVTGGAVYQGQKFYLDGGGDTFLESPSSNIMTFTTNAVEKMRIVSTGAVGIDNSSPDSFSGGGSTAASLVIGKGTSGVSPHLTLWQGNLAQAAISFASANSGAGQYEGRIRYTRDTGIMDFRTNGIANVLVLNASGNVGIGTDAPGRGLTIDKSNANAALEIIKNNTTNQIVYLGTGSSGGTDDPLLRMFHNGTENIRLYTTGDSWINGGNLGIGMTTPEAKLDIVMPNSGGATRQDIFRLLQTGQNTLSCYMYGGTTDLVQLHVSGPEQHLSLTTGGTATATTDTGIHIRSGGNVGIATLNPQAKLQVNQSGAALIGAIIKATDSGYYNQVLQISCARGATTGYNLIQGLNSNTTECFKVAGSGNVSNTNNSYGAISDVKLKENIIDATPKLEDLMQIKIRNYNIIGDKNKQIGVIAQELEEIFPSMIDESIDYEEQEITNEEGNVSTEQINLGTTTKSVKYSVFVPMLIKAIQELKADNDILKSRIETLENK